jgi:hypothetical protein
MTLRVFSSQDCEQATGCTVIDSDERTSAARNCKQIKRVLSSCDLVQFAAQEPGCVSLTLFIQYRAAHVDLVSERIPWTKL